MCINKIYIKDFYHNVGNYFNCGQCNACRQQSASRRARRIRNHSPRGQRCYFITLDYRNDAIPYVSKKALADFVSKGSKGYNVLPIYRDVKFEGFKKSLVSAPKTIIGLVDYNDLKEYSYDFHEVKTLRYLVRRYPSRHFRNDVDRVSVAFTKDGQDFLKRLRQNIKRIAKSDSPVTFFSCPEYGPTSCRFHMHFLVWADDKISYSKFVTCVRKAWPFSSRTTRKKFCEVATDAANYVSSYVNCSSDVSPSLQTAFPLRSSHSNYFGFDSSDFLFSNVFDAYKRRHFKYLLQYTTKSGQLVKRLCFYPSYVVNRYFPKFKGYNRINGTTLRSIYKKPELYLRTCPPACGTTKTDSLHFTSISDRYGRAISMTKGEAKSAIKRINYAYDNYFRPLGISRRKFAFICMDYHKGRASALYMDSFREYQNDDIYQCYFNVDEYNDYCRLHPELVVADIIGLYEEKGYPTNPNTFPSEYTLTMEYQKKFNSNIKTRKINGINDL